MSLVLITDLYKLYNLLKISLITYTLKDLIYIVTFTSLSA
jgi:hypothetical protein